MHYLIFLFKAESLRVYLLRSRYVSSAAPNTPLHSIRWPRVSPEQNQKVICVGGAHPFLLGGLSPFLKGPPGECPAALSGLWHGPWQLQQASRWCHTGALSPPNGSSIGRGKDMGFRVRQTCVLCQSSSSCFHPPGSQGALESQSLSKAQRRQTKSYWTDREDGVLMSNCQSEK